MKNLFLNFPFYVLAAKYLVLVTKEKLGLIPPVEAL